MSLDTQTFAEVLQGPGEFPGTVWRDVTDQKKVIHKYWSALRIYLVCLLSRFPDYRGEIDDLLQEFILRKILQPGWLENADPNKGRFRDFLKSSLKHFVVGEVRKRDAEKRGGKGGTLSLDEMQFEVPEPEDSSDSFDIAWLRMLLTEALQRMERGCGASGNEQAWKIFEARLLRPMLEGAAPVSYEYLVTEFHLRSPNQATNALATAKRMFARHLRDVIAQYETGDLAVRAEMDALKVFLGRLMPGQSVKAGPAGK